MSSRIFRYELLTQEQFSRLDRLKTVIFFPCGPLEQHGPHLPLAVDSMMAEYFSNAMAERLSERMLDWNFLIYPTLHLGCDALAHTGTVNVRQTVVREALLDTSGALAKQGFKTHVFMGAHGGPRHMVALEEVAAKLRWRFRAKAVSASARFLFDVLRGTYIQKLDDALKKNGGALSNDTREALKFDYHGGCLETSVMLHIRPDLVTEQYKSLPPALLSSLFKIRRNSTSKVGPGLGYLGTPALATVEIGRAFTELALEEMTPLLEGFLRGKVSARKFRSALYYVPFFRSHFRMLMILTVNLMAAFAAWMVFTQYLTHV